MFRKNLVDLAEWEIKHAQVRFEIIQRIRCTSNEKPVLIFHQLFSFQSQIQMLNNYITALKQDEDLKTPAPILS